MTIVSPILSAVYMVIQYLYEMNCNTARVQCNNYITLSAVQSFSVQLMKLHIHGLKHLIFLLAIISSLVVYPWSNLTVEHPHAFKKWLFIPDDTLQILNSHLLYGKALYLVPYL